jgi:hypothetical protein
MGRNFLIGDHTSRIQTPPEIRDDLLTGCDNYPFILIRGTISMRNGLHASILLCLGQLAAYLVAQSPSRLQLSQLCELQMKIGQGEHQTVRVEGVYLAGLESQYLVTAGCAGRSTDIEFELESHRLWKKLVKLSNETNTRKRVSGDGDPVRVIFEGEFFGPMQPDARMPEAVRKNYHPGWDSQNASMTKLVVHAILSVERLPPDHPCAPQGSEWPCFQNPAPVSR